TGTRTDWLTVVAVTAAVVSAIGVGGAFWAAMAANKGAAAMREAQTFLSLDDRYNPPEMCEALCLLREMWPENSGPFDGRKWLHDLESATTAEGKQKLQEQRAAVRRVKSYFFGTAHLIRIGGPEGKAAARATFRYGL